MFIFFSNRVGCLGSLLISIVLSAVLILAMRACNQAALERSQEPPAAPASGW